MRSDLFAPQHIETTTTERFALQNPHLLRVALDGEVLALQGSMVAYQGQLDFDFEGSGGLGKFLKKAVTGEGMPLMRVRGRGELFLARSARRVFLIQLDNDAISVNGDNVLAFDPTLTWDIRRVQGASMMAGGVFNTTLTGTGTVAITADGQPLVLDAGSQPTYVDIQSAIAWSTALTTSVHRTFKMKALIGRGSGEVAQLAFSGTGFVVVQPSEGGEVPPHDHGSGGGGIGNLLGG
jgi:uncharacterized protein (AIM24 family)